MTLDEFLSFTDFCFAQMDVSVESDDTGAIINRKGLIVRIARQTLAAAHFASEFTNERREKPVECANAYFSVS